MKLNKITPKKRALLAFKGYDLNDIRKESKIRMSKYVKIVPLPQIHPNNKRFGQVRNMARCCRGTKCERNLKEEKFLDGVVFEGQFFCLQCADKLELLLKGGRKILLS
jgi:hypothetical protein